AASPAPGAPPRGGARGARSARRRRSRWRRGRRPSGRSRRLRGQQLEEDGLVGVQAVLGLVEDHAALVVDGLLGALLAVVGGQVVHEHAARAQVLEPRGGEDRKSTRLNSSHVKISYAVFCL